jgi:GNAT superfamily N-acetyltransferase
MKIIDLEKKYESLYFHCLEDWSDEMKESGSLKESWYKKMSALGLRVKLALDEHDQVGGMIQYTPIEYSPAIGHDLYFINCIWVHGHKKGRGNFQKKGMGKALLQTAEEDTKQLNAKGIAAWGISLPFWMKASWYKKQGYKKVDSFKGAVLLWKPFADDALAPKWIRPQTTPEPNPKKITITAYINGWCPASNLTFERVKRAAEKYPEQVELKVINTFDNCTRHKCGYTDAIFINGKQLRAGPPMNYSKILKKIEKLVKKITKKSRT